MTGEAGGGNFWAPVSQIIQLCKENCFQNLQLAYAAGAYYDVQDLDDMAIPSGNITGNLSCQVRKIGLGNGQVTISFIPILNITTSTPPITTTISNYFDTYDATFNYTLPGSIAALGVYYPVCFWRYTFHDRISFRKLYNKLNQNSNLQYLF